MSIERKKTEARALIRFLAEKGITLSQTQALEAVAAMAGSKNWSTEKARLETQAHAQQEFLRDVASTPLTGEFCDGELQSWADQEHVYGRLERLVTDARALMGLPLGERPALYGTPEGWSGSQAFPCFRQGRLAVSVSDLSDVSDIYLWADFSECTEQGEPTDNNFGLTCLALPKTSSSQARQNFVLLAAKLFSAFVTENASVRSIGHFLTRFAEGLTSHDVAALAVIAKALDQRESANAVVDSIEQMLLDRLGPDQAQADLDDIVDDVCREAGLCELNSIEDDDAQDAFLDELEANISDINNEGISGQLHYLCEQIGKAKLREFLAERLNTPLVPEVVIYEK